MFEPRQPLTFRVRTTPRPGVRLERDVFMIQTYGEVSLMLLSDHTGHAPSISCPS